jgi:hypothetical protein
MHLQASEKAPNDGDAAIQVVLPGLAHWSAYHDGIGQTVYSSFALGSGTLIDPIEPAEGLDRIAELAVPRRIVLSNRHHFRDSARIAERFGCPILCHEAGLYEFAGEHDVHGFSFDELLADGVRALELAAICPEETTLLLDLAPGALAFADGLTRDRGGALAFMPDRLLGDDAATVRAGLRKNLRRMLEEDFDALLFAHAEPVLEGGYEMLSEFLARAAGT